MYTIVTILLLENGTLRLSQFLPVLWSTITDIYLQGVSGGHSLMTLVTVFHVSGHQSPISVEAPTQPSSQTRK